LQALMAILHGGWNWAAIQSERVSSEGGENALGTT